jgi:hypothetical protein
MSHAALKADGPDGLHHTFQQPLTCGQLVAVTLHMVPDLVATVLMPPVPLGQAVPEEGVGDALELELELEGELLAAGELVGELVEGVDTVLKAPRDEDPTVASAPVKVWAAGAVPAGDAVAPVGPAVAPVGPGPSPGPPHERGMSGAQWQQREGCVTFVYLDAAERPRCKRQATLADALSMTEDKNYGVERGLQRQPGRRNDNAR